jgi:hypothetical protein
MVDRGRFWRNGFFASLVAIVLVIGSLAPHLHDSAELVRMRNALVFDAASESTRFDWTPADMPADFTVERKPATPIFKQAIVGLGLASLSNDWERALALGRHLLVNRREHVGDPIQSDLESTYRLIQSGTKGYCGDYVDVFSALAIAANVPVRSWAFSFDGFGGHGHVFNEIWDAQAQRWRMIDVFHNYYVTGPDGLPVSALEFRAAMLRRPESLKFHPIDPDALPVFKYEAKARQFYERGLGQWYLWWGNDVFTYDDALLVRAFGPVSRALEQLGGIAEQVFPHIRAMVDAGNRAQVQAMRRLKVHLWVALLLTSIAAAAAIVCLVGWRRARREAVP